MSTLPKWAEDAVYTDVYVTLGFVDRLRILARGRFSVSVVTHTEHVIGRTSTNSMFTAPRFFSRKHNIGYSEDVPPPVSVEPKQSYCSHDAFGAHTWGVEVGGTCSGCGLPILSAAVEPVTTKPDINLPWHIAYEPDPVIVGADGQYIAEPDGGYWPNEDQLQYIVTAVNEFAATKGIESQLEQARSKLAARAVAMETVDVAARKLHARVEDAEKALREIQDRMRSARFIADAWEILLIAERALARAATAEEGTE